MRGISKGSTVLSVIMLAWLLAFAPVAAHADIMWGANGHPLISYPNIGFEQQLDYLKDLGMKSYRVDIADAKSAPQLARLVREARSRGIEILPVITPPFDRDKETAESLYAKAYQLAFSLVSQFKTEIRVWELGNEMEVYAIIKACEMQDNGVQYNCSWGPAGGVGPLDYYGPRWAKTSAVLKGLSDGTLAADPTVRKAMGTAGWGHIGAFERMQKDGIRWDISVWHMYGDDPEWGFKALNKFGHPIWVTEFNNPNGSKAGEQGQAQGLEKTVQRLRELRSAYNVEAAHVYELLDEPYWGSDFEAVMGLVKVEKDATGKWTPGLPKVAYSRMKELIAAGSQTGTVAGRTPAPTAGAGGVSRACQLDDLKTANESKRDEFAYISCLIFGRVADEAGANEYAKLKAGARSIPDVLVGLLDSREFAAKHDLSGMDNQRYVDLLYQLLLARPPDGAGLMSYLARLENKTLSRPGLAREIIASEEFQTKHRVLFPPTPAATIGPSRRCALSDFKPEDESPRSQVAYSYCLILGHAPSDAEAEDHANLRMQGLGTIDVLLALILSREFAEANSISKLDNRQYISLLYHVLLGRQPDGRGLTDYLERVESNTMTRTELPRAIIGSDEFRAKNRILFPAR